MVNKPLQNKSRGKEKAAAKPVRASKPEPKPQPPVQEFSQLLASSLPGMAPSSWNGLHVLALDASTREVLVRAGADTLRDPASLTKLMTFYLVQEAIAAGKMTLDDPVRVPIYARDLEANKVKAGSEYTIRTLLDAMMGKSCNGAAAALADHFGPGFVQQMNAKAALFGMSKTHFVNPHGLPVKSADVNTSSATDIATLVGKVHERFGAAFMEHSGKHEVQIGDKTLRANHWLNTPDSPLALPPQHRIAAKTGYTIRAGHNLAGLVEGPGGRKMIVVVMGGEEASYERASKLGVPDEVLRLAQQKGQGRIKGNRVVNAVVQDLVTELMPSVKPERSVALTPTQYREHAPPNPAPPPASASRKPALLPEDTPIVTTVPLPRRDGAPIVPTVPPTQRDDTPIVSTVPLPRRDDDPPPAAAASAPAPQPEGVISRWLSKLKDLLKPTPPPSNPSASGTINEAPASTPTPPPAKPRAFVTHSIAGIPKDDLKAVDACKTQLKATGVVPSRPGPESTATVSLQPRPRRYAELENEESELRSSLGGAEAKLRTASTQLKTEKVPKKRKALQGSIAGLKQNVQNLKGRIAQVDAMQEVYTQFMQLENQADPNLYTQKNYDAVIARSKEYIDGFVDHWNGRLPSGGREGLRQMMYAIAEGSAGMETGWNPTIVKGAANRGTYTGVYQTGWPFIADAAQAIERNPGMVDVLKKYPEDKKVLDFAEANHSSLKGQPTTSFAGQAASFTAMMVANYRRVAADEKADLDKFSGANTYKEHMLGRGGADQLAKQLRENHDKKGSPGMSEKVYNANFMLADKPFAQMNDLNPKRIMYQDVTAQDVEDMLRNKFIHARNKQAGSLATREMSKGEAEKHIAAFERAFLPEWTNNPTQRANDIARMEHQKQIGFEWRQSVDVKVPDKTAICHILKPMPPVGKPRL